MHRLERLRDILRALWIERQFRSHDSWTPKQLAEYQQRRLTEAVAHAAAHSPFYRELYRHHLSDTIRLQDLPITDKRMLMDNFDSVVTDPRLTLDRVQQHLRTVHSDELYLGQYRVITTSGTSGLRGIFVYDRTAWSVVLANAMRWGRFAGVAPRWPRRLRLCTIGADTPVHVSQRIPGSGNVGLYRMRHLDVTRPLADLVDALNAFQPEVLMPYPSVASLLAGEQMAGRLDIRPSVVTTHSEILSEEMARRIRTAWGVTPFDHYGLSEEPNVGCECGEHRGIHIFEDTCIVELLDERNRPASPGRLGHKCLLTNLYNRTQPLIRYEISDMLAKSAEPCSCGRPFALITQIGGRGEDMLILKDRRGRDVAIPPMGLTNCIDAVTDVAEYQIRHNPECIRLQVVPQPGADTAELRANLRNTIELTVSALGAKTPPIEVRFVSRLERRRAHMGKIRLVARPSVEPNHGPSGAESRKGKP